jgi:hypothetical protein
VAVGTSGGSGRNEHKASELPPLLSSGGRSSEELFRSVPGDDRFGGLEGSGLIEYEMRLDRRGSRRFYERLRTSQVALSAVGGRLSLGVEELHSPAATSFLLERRQSIGPGVEREQQRLAFKVCGCPPPVGEAGRVKPLVECFVDLFVLPAEEPGRRQCRLVWRIESGPSQVVEGEQTLVEAVGELPKILRQAVDGVISTGLEQLGVSPRIARKVGKVGGLLFEAAVARPLLAPLKAAAMSSEVIGAVLPGVT